MVYILLTILTTLLLLVLFKLFQRYNVNVFIAIIINYITATITGIVTLDTKFDLKQITNSEWITICIPLGGVFIGIFYLISQTAQKINLSTASVANKMSVVIPVLFSVIFLQEPLSISKIIGIIFALLAVYLSTRAGEHAPHIKKLIWLPVLVFLGSGLIDLTINATSAFYVKSNHESALFSITTFFSAFTIGLCLIIYQLLFKRSEINALLSFKNIAGGVALGIPNYFSIYFLFKSLDAKIMSSAQLFTLLNLSNVVLAAVIGSLFFKEKLSWINISGIVIAVAAIILITL